MKTLYKSPEIVFYEEEKKVYIQILQETCSISDINAIIAHHCPRIKVTKFAAIGFAQKNIGKSIEVGVELPLLRIEVSGDGLEAYGRINASEMEFQSFDHKILYEAIKRECYSQNIQDLLPFEEVNAQLASAFIIAKGIPQIDGEDAQIHMYEVSEIHPSIETTGSVDHYELNIINKVSVGDWLGERSEPTKGIPGKSIYGTLIKAKDGLQKNLFYDEESVGIRFDQENQKTVLFAKKNGAVVYHGEKISIHNHIDVEGDVGYATGNIDFNGYVTISGTVDDNFSVIANQTVQINGEMGVGAAKLIESRMEDVCIQGGVSGRHKALIKAKKDVYLKYASDCTIIAEGSVKIGFYAMNCDITAKELLFETKDSKLIGGIVRCRTKVEVGEIGTKNGTKTEIQLSENGEIKATKAMYSNVGITIQNKSTIHDNVTALPVTYSFVDDELRCK
ncbi:MAG: DUF342 domain-containing protein [Vallitaleaceae bacterium]|nr:DUF342 domain-containing protein [Vallitaleaceae bacterium]